MSMMHSECCLFDTIQNNKLKHHSDVEVSVLCVIIQKTWTETAAMQDFKQLPSTVKCYKKRLWSEEYFALN